MKRAEHFISARVLLVLFAMLGTIQCMAQAPEWVTRRPVSDNEYIGIGIAKLSDNDYMKVSVPSDFEGGNVVFHNNNGSQVPSSGGYQVPYSGSTLLTNGAMINYVPITTTGISGNFYVNAGDWGNGVDVVAHVWNGDNEAKIKLNKVENGIYGGALPEGVWKYVQVLRCSGDTVINKCIYYRIPEGKNMFTLKITNGNWNDVAGIWSVYGGSGQIATTAPATAESRPRCQGWGCGPAWCFPPRPPHSQ